MRLKKLYAAIENSKVEDKDLMLTRVKLEMRTWLLRASLGFNVSLVTGLIVWLITK